MRSITPHYLESQIAKLADYTFVTANMIEAIDTHMEQQLGYPAIARRPTAVLALAMAVHRTAGTIDPDVHMHYVSCWQGLYSTLCQLANESSARGHPHVVQPGQPSGGSVEQGLLEQLSDQIYTLCGILMRHDEYRDPIERMAAKFRSRNAGERAQSTPLLSG